MNLVCQGLSPNNLTQAKLRNPIFFKIGFLVQ